MQIRTFTFKDLQSAWCLEEVHFERLNLLVGMSGVGKTKVLESLRRVVLAGLSMKTNLMPMEWRLAFEHNGSSFEWSGRIELRTRNGHSAKALDLDGERNNAVFTRERLVQDDVELFSREFGSMKMKGAELPALSSEISLLCALGEDSQLDSAVSALSQVFFSSYSGGGVRASSAVVPTSLVSSLFTGISQTTKNGRAAKGKRQAKGAKSDPPTRAGARVSFAKGRNGSKIRGVQAIIPPVARPLTFSDMLISLYMQQETASKAFLSLVGDFCEIFPSVKGLRIQRTDLDAERVQLRLELSESNEYWLTQEEMSAGMLRTLIHLWEFSFLPGGWVLIVDEFENSLGGNCLPRLTERLLSRADCQFILTSHHPYVINGIPIANWSIVQRKLCAVRVIPSRDVPELVGSSKLNAFTRLLNTPAYTGEE